MQSGLPGGHDRLPSPIHGRGVTVADSSECRETTSKPPERVGKRVIVCRTAQPLTPALSRRERGLSVLVARMQSKAPATPPPGSHPGYQARTLGSPLPFMGEGLGERVIVCRTAQPLTPTLSRRERGLSVHVARMQSGAPAALLPGSHPGYQARTLGSPLPFMGEGLGERVAVRPAPALPRGSAASGVATGTASAPRTG
ncbi:hypothetical protein PSEWESI4_04617 [Pseudomonas carbonaria]|uniref:Uncharacterized protein n=1 Tax=Zestomonas carbonaria TaxID=2762745 RepID=A0A7U7ESF3_9GAMM|nr:hypothetical protein PSEWESI4_04617 [Pseudomonas carbonaria]